MLLDTFWHKTLGRPYRLAKVTDVGNGAPVVLLHGIGKSGQVWQHVVRELQARGQRAVAFDLLGFGKSPKPDWIDYDVDDHAAAVIASIERLRVGEPIVIVGHSMGCLVAVRVARLRPDLVKHLVLYEMPLYEGLPDKWRYRLRTDLYYKFYARVIAYQPTFNLTTATLAERLARKVIGFEVDEETWPSFIKSLQNTIMDQTADSDIPQLQMPMDVIYGSYDMLVIRGKPQEFFGTDNDNIAAHVVKARHTISPAASQFIVSRIAVIG
jgi:pimeloyl-ACP methyl ester carboxylesterase